MDQQTLIEQISSKIKLIRVERGYTQDRMAAVLGISKKTLVQIEKGRTEANWTTVVAVCALFRSSDLVKSLLGGDVLEVIETVAHHHVDQQNDQSHNPQVWWTTILEQKDYLLQQNVVSEHYRIIDRENNRLYSCLNKDEAEAKMLKLSHTF
ncbi:helix-turn-helix transcriptional regulator [Radiobacillus sp. PE A8.2]|uniref:helix-turn-helix transcriptional regulator n=1 Tax=Radiobacillus sp. PE A8.2 TaxID=3380349 RepID=UPI00388F097D